MQIVESKDSSLIFKAVLNLLEVFLYNRKPNEPSRLLAQICGDASLKETCYEILLKCGIIDENADRFLVLAGIDEKFSKLYKRLKPDLCIRTS